METTQDIENGSLNALSLAQEAARVYQDFSNDSSQHSEESIDRETVHREILDEDGDILIKAASLELLVSSKILTLASPVFKAMLGYRFKEGSTARSAEHPLELPLPDDNPEALALLCHTLHFSVRPESMKPDIAMQFELAFVADKYDCIASIHAFSEQWLRAVSEKNCGSSVLWEASAIAFMLGHAGEFARFAARLASSLSAAQLDSTIPIHGENFKGVFLNFLAL